MPEKPPPLTPPPQSGRGEPPPSQDPGTSISGREGAPSPAPRGRDGEGAARPHLILPVGTQVVSRIDLRDARGNVVCPAGAVGEVIQAPLDGTHS